MGINLRNGIKFLKFANFKFIRKQIALLRSKFRYIFQKFEHDYSCKYEAYMGFILENNSFI